MGNLADNLPRKILLVSNCAWSLYNSRHNLIMALEEQGWQVLVAAPEKSYVANFQHLHSVRFIPLRHLCRKATFSIRNLLLLFELQKLYLREHPDFILHFTIKPNVFGSLAASWLEIPFINVVTGLGYTFLDGWGLNRIVRLLYKLSFRKSSKVVFENPDDLALFYRLNLIEKDQGAIVNGCGVDIRHFNPGHTPERKNGKRGFTFTFISRLLRDKGLLEFMDAAVSVKKKYPHAEFEVAGALDQDNPSAVSTSELLQLVNNGLVHYSGFNKDVRPLIANSDCIVLPSYREGLPKICLEAMAMGKPLIVTDVAGCRQVAEHGVNGFLVPVKSSDALSLAMEQMLLLDAKELDAMGKASRRKVEREFRDEVVVRQYFDILEELIGVSSTEKELQCEVI
ncbi:MAG: glycosyltransferase family 4 protein [Saprospiraceae bacterium]